jgi:hypothetical protein
VSFSNNLPQQQIPGASFAISLQSSPHSHVGILAVDQSVYLLRNDKHLTHDEVRMLIVIVDDSPLVGNPWALYFGFSSINN